MSCRWKGRLSGHIICVDRDEKGDLRLYDPQDGEIIQGDAINNYIKGFQHYRDYRYQGRIYFTQLMRVDNLEFEPFLVNEILEANK